MNSRPDDCPICCALKRPIGVDGARVEVIGEHDAMPNKNAILDLDAITNKAVARDLAVFANRSATLNLNKGADLGAGAYRAAVKID